MNSIEEFMVYACPFGYLDVKMMCEIGDQVGLCENDLFEIVQDFKEIGGISDFGEIDPVYCVLVKIMWLAIDFIEERIDHDFRGIYVHGNYICSSFVWPEEDQECFIDKLEDVPEMDKKAIMGNPFCCYFLAELDIQILKKEA